MSDVGTGVAVVGAVAAAAALAFSKAGQSLVTAVREPSDSTPIQPTAPAQTQIQRFAGLADREYNSHTPPSTARQVPLATHLTRTPMVTGRTGKLERSDPRFPELLTTLRGHLRAAGRGSDDARAVLFLYIVETGWDSCCFGFNGGNVKAAPRIWASSASILAPSPTVWLTHPEANGAYLLVDRGHSFDAYPSFPSFPAFFRFQRWLFTVGNPNYAAAAAGYQRGELEGLLAADEALCRGGYSGPGRRAPAAILQRFVDQRQSDARAFWARCERRLGVEWVR